MNQPYERLLSLFGHKSFLSPQREIIDSVINKKSVLAIMPTGGGKSLCYQLPALALEGTAIVLSPLIALMKDQVDHLKALNVDATEINSNVSRLDREKRQKNLRDGKYKILLVTPERFKKTDFLEAIQNSKISFLAIDEAHCISQWGHDFRPEYSRVGEIKKKLNVPVLAMTATATEKVEAEIRSVLAIESGNVFRAPIARPNLRVRVEDLHGLGSKAEQIAKVSKSIPGPKIIYASLIQSLYNMSAELKKLKIRHTIYHGQLPDNDRRNIQNDFLKSEGGLLLATPAFGLGINKPNIRVVMHAELPASIEAYFQEIGRGGRDGNECECILLYDEDDITIQMDFLKWSNPEPEFIEKVLSLIRTNATRVRQEGEDFLRQQMNFYNSRDFRVETSLNLLRSWGVLEGWEVIGELTDDLLQRELRQSRLRHQQEKLLAMVQWVQSDTCRMQSIYKYFAQPSQTVCGKCDICLREP